MLNAQIAMAIIRRLELGRTIQRTLPDIEPALRLRVSPTCRSGRQQEAIGHSGRLESGGRLDSLVARSLLQDLDASANPRLITLLSTTTRPRGLTRMARNLKLLPELVGLLALLGTAHADTGASEVLRLANVAASRVTTCQATADDLGAEAAMRFLRTHREVPEGDSNPAGYLRRIVDNLRRDWLRRESRVRAFSEIDASHLELVERADGHSNPAEVAEFVAGLKPGEREVLELMIEGLGEREIALGIGNTRHGVRAVMRGIRARASEYFDPPTS